MKLGRRDEYLVIIGSDGGVAVALALAILCIVEWRRHGLLWLWLAKKMILMNATDEVMMNEIRRKSNKAYVDQPRQSKCWLNAGVVPRGEIYFKFLLTCTTSIQLPEKNSFQF